MQTNIETLGNGLVRIFDRASKLAGLFRTDGTQVGGDLRLSPSKVRALLTVRS